MPTYASSSRRHKLLLVRVSEVGFRSGDEQSSSNFLKGNAETDSDHDYFNEPSLDFKKIIKLNVLVCLVPLCVHRSHTGTLTTTLRRSLSLGRLSDVAPVVPWVGNTQVRTALALASPTSPPGARRTARNAADASALFTRVALATRTVAAPLLVTAVALYETARAYPTGAPAALRRQETRTPLKALLALFRFGLLRAVPVHVRDCQAPPTWSKEGDECTHCFVSLRLFYL